MAIGGGGGVKMCPGGRAGTHTVGGLVGPLMTTMKICAHIRHSGRDFTVVLLGLGQHDGGASSCWF